MNNRNILSRKKDTDTYFEEILAEILHENDGELMNSSGIFKAMVERETVRKCRELEKSAKHRREILLIVGAYAGFMSIIALFLWNFLLCGFNRIHIHIAIAFGIVSILLLCLVPILLKFNNNPFERRDCQNEIKSIH